MSNGKRLKRNYFHSGDGDVQEISKRFKKGSSPKAARIARINREDEDDHFDWKQEVAKIEPEPEDENKDFIDQ